MGRLSSVLALSLAVLVGYLLGTSPPGVSPPHVPAAGPMAEVPPWPIFRVAVGLNDFFRTAWEATTLPKVRVIELSTAKWHSHVIYSLTKNGIFDAVHAVPLSCEATAATLKLNAPFLCRLMAAGETLGLLKQGSDGAFGTTATSSLLLSGLKGGQKAFVEMINNPEISAGWDAIGSESLKSGKGGFETAYQESFWQRISSRPHLEKQFDAAMSSFTAVSAGALGPVHEHACASASAGACIHTRTRTRRRRRPAPSSLRTPSRQTALSATSAEARPAPCGCSSSTTRARRWDGEIAPRSRQDRAR